MLRRLFLMALLTVTMSLPVVVFAEDAGPSSENTRVLLNYDDDVWCDDTTLGVSEDGASVKIKAVWFANTYTCEAGNYLKTTAESVACEPCPMDSYCTGFVDYAYDTNESDYGMQSCPTGYHTDGTGSTQRQDCYKTETIACSEKSPYTVGHARQIVYNNESTTCTQHLGNEEICDVSCEVTDVICETGYEAQEEDGVWTCVDVAVSCGAGTYLPHGETECEECPENHFCSGGRYAFSNDDDQGIETCQNSLKSPKGTVYEQDCGKLLRIEGDALYLHADKRGSGPSLAIKDKNGNVWYANTTPVGEDGSGAKPVSDGATKQLHFVVDGVEYTVHTSLYQE